jgi:hypothetical protein
MFHEEVTTKNGVVKQVIGQTQEELPRKHRKLLQRRLLLQLKRSSTILLHPIFD